MPMRRAILLSLLAVCPCVFALDPALDVSQYGHKSWLFRDGFAQGQIFYIAQTSDGYLWFATERGLLRFDGVKPAAWQPPTGQSLPSDTVLRLLASRDGTLWIGTLDGLASWKNGRLNRYREFDGFYVMALIQDHEGSIWAGGREPTGYGKVCKIGSGDTQCETGTTHPGSVHGLYEDRKGNLWVATGTGLWRWKPGPQEFFPLGQPNGILNIAEDEQEGILIGTPGRVVRLMGREFRTAYPLPVALRQNTVGPVLLRDRDGSLWIGTDGGLEHIHQGRADVFLQRDGLSGATINRLFEDAEGSIWVATNAGLDRFRELPIVTYSRRQGLSSDTIGQILGTRDGSLWFSSRDGLNRMKDGRPILYHPANDVPVPGVQQIALRGFSKVGLGGLFEDSRGRVWLPTLAGVGYLENDRYVATPSPGGFVWAAAEDASGDVWVCNRDRGLLRVSPGKPVERIPWSTLGHKDAAMEMIGDPARGGLWLGFIQGGIVYFRDGQLRETYSASNGLGKGRVYQFRFDSEGALWIGTDGGLSRLKDGRVATLTSANGLPCDTVQWATEDNNQSVWMHTACGLLRVPRVELEAWASAADKTQQKVRGTVFDSSGGVRLRTVLGSNHPYFAKTPDGKLWFATLEGLSMVDPRRLPFNKLPPPVHVERIIADRQTYWENLSGDAPSNPRLPPLVRDLTIDYAALSLAAPEKIRFRYMLEGRDRDWRDDVDNRRQAVYNDLPPRKYRFRVIASNESGVWNETGASFDFSIEPKFYQTRLFQTSCVAAFLAMLWGTHRLRLLYVTRQFNLRLEERVAERTRIARDLHDTLLQSFQGVLLKFSTARYLMRERPDDAEEMLERTIDQAREAITQGRDKVQGLRSSTVIANDLVRAITTFGAGLAGDTGQNGPELRVQVEGKSRDLPPLIRDEVYHVACESLRNAFRHAHARRIEVEFRYDPRQFRLRVVDNGKGIDPAVLSAGGRAGHYGLPGIRERAELAGGKLSIWSRLDAGTEIELTIPHSIAYAKSSPVRRSRSSGEGTG